MSISDRKRSRKQVDKSETAPGQQLRQLRKEKDISVEVVAEATKISIKNIRAIEESAFEKLPANTFVRGLVTLYGNFLGMDGRKIAAEFLAERKKIDPGTRKNNLTTKKISSSSLSPKKLAEPSHISSATVALLLLMVIVLSFTGFCLYTSWNPFAFLSRQTDNMQASIQRIFTGDKQPKTDKNASIPLKKQEKHSQTTSGEEQKTPVTADQEARADAAESKVAYRLSAHFIHDSGVVVTLDDQEPIRKKYSAGEVVNWNATRRLKVVFDVPKAATLILNNGPLAFPTAQNRQPPTLQLPDDLLDQ